MDITQFWTICSANSIVLSVEQLKNFERYHNELIYWNSKVNLISRKDEDNIFEKHFLHSISILKYIKMPPKARCLDIGTGGGFPGLPLKIANPDIHMTLIDSIKKKVTITKMFADHTGLRNIHVLTMRAEELRHKRDFTAHFDFIFARAVSKLSNLVNWSYDYLKANGLFVFLKGGDLSQELNEMKSQFPIYILKLNQLKFSVAIHFELTRRKLSSLGRSPLKLMIKSYVN